MIYEYRIYHTMPGKMPQLNERFAKTTIALFEKHGMKVVGFWTPVIGAPSNQLVYMLAYDDLARRERAWAAFSSDPEWLKARELSEVDGPLISHFESIILRPTGYSPLQ